MNGSLIPANTKKATLFLGMFRPFPDLVVFCGGTLTTILLLVLLPDVETWLLMVFCIPMVISCLLVMPIPNYHNTLCVIQSIFEFYTGRRNFIWKGWCIYDEFKERK